MQRNTTTVDIGASEGALSTLRSFRPGHRYWAWLVIPALLAGCGEHQEPGTPIDQPRALVTRAEPDPATGKRILFGDLHVHTTFSPDAFVTSMPILGGEGMHPPADACDFARFCSALDFWSINDHAEGVSPRHWRETMTAIKQCNAVGSDTVAFLGWEWTQVGATPETHFGHRNVVLRDLDPQRVPARAIAAPREDFSSNPLGFLALLGLLAADFSNRDFYLAYREYYRELEEVPACGDGPSPELTPDCLETAATPRDLFRKLDEWQTEALVIPHGISWGLSTPPGFNWDLLWRQHDPRYEVLLEMYSGHGNSEEYRPWRSVDFSSGAPRCPAPVPGFTPCCHRAGEIIRERCAAEGLSAAECDGRAQEARSNYAASLTSGYLTVPGQQMDDWQDCGICTDCFSPAYEYRPGGSAQYALATGGGSSAAPRRFRFGLLGSSDNHRGRPGTGYKEFARHGMTDVFGQRGDLAGMEISSNVVREPRSRSLSPAEVAGAPLSARRNSERQASFYTTGGLAAVHSNAADSQAIYDALRRREVYATSGDRLMLWFDALTRDRRHPMGSEFSPRGELEFEVRALGAFEQLPGCPEQTLAQVGRRVVDRLCLGECYNPGSRRHRIERIEVVKILPRQEAEEGLEQLVQDPWRVFPCSDTGEGCQVRFSDPDFAVAGREALYYARAIQEPTPAINGAGLRCEYDAQGNCIKVNPCYGDYRTDPDDDCLAPTRQRAWSSPIRLLPEG